MIYFDIFMVLFGSYLLYGVLFKPDFFWERRRMKLRRSVLGDKGTFRMYLILSIVMITIGLIGASSSL